MPLTARLRSTGKVVSILDYRQPRRELDAADLVCPHCDRPLIIRHGLIRMRHFAHRPDHRCPYESWQEVESARHLAFKQAVCDYLQTSPAWCNVATQLEVKIEEAGRIADVMATVACCWRIAHECQVSAITLEELQARTQSYWNAGVDVMWWFDAELLKRSAMWLKPALLSQQGVILGADVFLEEGAETPQIELFAETEQCCRLPLEYSDPRKSTWPWNRYLPRQIVPATVGAFPAGHYFTLQDIWQMMPAWVRSPRNDGAVNFALCRLWEKGQVVKIGPGQWATPGHPDFCAAEWQEFSKNREPQGQGHLERTSRAYHVLLWQRRIEAAESLPALEEVGRLIAESELNPKVRQELRAFYAARRQALKQRG